MKFQTHISPLMQTGSGQTPGTLDESEPVEISVEVHYDHQAAERETDTPESIELTSVRYYVDGLRQGMHFEFLDDLSDDDRQRLVEEACEDWEQRQAKAADTDAAAYEDEMERKAGK